MAPLARSVTHYQTRRQVNTKLISSFFLAIASGSGGGVASGLAVHEIKKADEKATKEKEDAELANDIFDEIFGPIGHDWGYNLGKWYKHGDFHRDHDAAFKGIQNARPSMVSSNHSITISIPKSQEIETVNRLLYRPIKEQYVLIGGPVSTPLIRKVWQYESPHMDDTSLQITDDPLLPLPYSFLINNKDDRMDGMEHVSWNFADGSGEVADSPNRLLLNRRRTDQLIKPKLSKEFHFIKGKKIFLPYENYLIITRLPNFLSEKFDGRYPDLWGSLVSIQATHGIGTRAVGLLLTHKGKDPLLEMKRAVSDARAFQAIFKVSKPVDINGVDSFTNIEYLNSVVLDDDIPLRNYKILRKLIFQTEGYSAYL